MQWPGNYVFSEWSWSRLYNYFVSGNSQGYGYARANYVDFISTTDPESWYQRLGDRRGFVVTSPVPGGTTEQLGIRLHEFNGSMTPETPGLGHYRLVYVSGEYKVFTVVPGAVLEGMAEPNQSIVARTTVDLKSGSFEYASRTTSTANGSFRLRVAQPGTYNVGDGSVRVSDSAVENGSVINVKGE